MTRAITISVCAALVALLTAACGAHPPATTPPTVTAPTLTHTTEPAPPVTTVLTSTTEPTPMAVTPAASSLVSGTVELAGGACCAGGTAGDTIEVEAAFAATSTAGTVDTMRVRIGGTCFTEADLDGIAWEPFVPRRQYPFGVVINWVGYALSVQYRDDKENISPVACDDISIEGSPPRPGTAP